MFIGTLYDFRETSQWTEMRNAILAIMRASKATDTELEIMNFMLKKFAILEPVQSKKED